MHYRAFVSALPLGTGCGLGGAAAAAIGNTASSVPPLMISWSLLQKPRQSQAQRRQYHECTSWSKRQKETMIYISPGRVMARAPGLVLSREAVRNQANQ